MRKLWQSLKFKIIFSMFGSFTIIAIIMATMIIKQSRNQALEKADNALIAFNKMFNNQAESTSQLMEMTLDGILQDVQLKTAFALKDRETVKNILLHFYKTRLKPVYGIAQFQFHTPPATSFLRLHKPQKFGDDLSSFRKTVVQANRTLKTIRGIEVGRGGPGLRVVKPVFDGIEHIGTVEFGSSIAKLLETAAQIIGVDYAIGIEEDVFKRARRFEGKDTDLKKNSLIFYTFSSPLVKEVIKNNEVNSELHTTVINGTNYSFKSFPIVDYSGEKIGWLTVVKNIEQEIAAMGKIRLKLLGVMFLLSVLFISFTFIFLNKTIFIPLQESAKMTADIEMGNLNVDNVDNIDYRDDANEMAYMQNSVLRMGVSIMRQMGGMQIIIDTLALMMTKHSIEDSLDIVLQGAIKITGAKKGVIATVNREECKIDKFISTEISEREKEQISEFLQTQIDNFHNQSATAIKKFDEKNIVSFTTGNRNDDTQLFIPIIEDNKFIGSFLLWDKKKGKEFDREDKNIITNLSQLLPIILNAQKSQEEITRIKNYLENETYGISQVIETLSQGDFTVSIEASSTDDDLGKIRNGLLAMTNNIKDILNQLKEVTESVSSASNQIDSLTMELASGTQEQSSQAGDVAAAMEEMTLTIQDNSQNADTTAQMADESGKIANESAEIIRNTITKMEEIAKIVKETALTVEKLGESSNKIGEIISVIDEIADQTNLLALNAAIEAARAGEHGKGFAVVADEIRKLAERSGVATKEIADIIKAIQNETNGAVKSMRYGTKEVDAGMELADQAGKSLDNIMSSVTQVRDMVNQIAVASEQQSKTSEEISRNVEAISAVSEESANGVSQIASVSENLRMLTEQLKQNFEKFKI